MHLIRFFQFALLISFHLPVLASPLSPLKTEASLSRDQSKVFRSWLVTIVEDQISRGPNPRWNQKDCAGMLRFAVSESLLRHDEKWRKANGFLGRALPAELEISQAQREKFKLWRTGESKPAQFARALPLIQGNTEFIGKTIERIEPGDLLFFDQGDEQHLMVWTGRRIVYHNGHRPVLGEKITDKGLRAVTLKELMNFTDSRWQPRVENPNFVGFYRLAFLASPSMNEQGKL